MKGDAMSTTTTPERITQRCPGCGRQLRIPPEMKGQQVVCKFCDHSVLVADTEHLEPEQGLSHVGTGTAFQIERVWTGGADKEARYTLIRHPLKLPLKGYSLAIECHGPGRLHVAGLKAKDGQAISLGKVRPNETRIIPLDDVSTAYLWLDKGATTSMKLIVAR
jgi:hypothetical protein